MVTRYRRMNFRKRNKVDWPEPTTWVCLILFAAYLVWGVSKAEAADARLMMDIIRCESGFKHNAIGDDGLSRGLAQFRKETFYEFAAMAQQQRKWQPYLGKPAWMNPQQQLFLLEWGLDNGYGARWTCWRKMKGVMG